MRPTYKPLALFLLLALALAACTGGGASPTATPATAPSQPETQATAAGAPAAEATQPPPPEVEPTPAEETFQAEKVTEGLATLKSYRATFTMAFEGTQEGKPVQWTFEMKMEATKDPVASRLTYMGSGTEDASKLSGFEIVQVGDMQYMKFGEGAGNCIASSAGEQTSEVGEIFKPDDILGGLSNARRAGPDQTINGVRARHYTFDEKALLGLSGLTRAQGEAWVAVDGNYVVKYTLTAEGRDVLFGKPNTEGKLTWTYEVTDINQAFEITPPADCQGPAEDIPLMADATEKSTFGSMITYKTASAFKDVVAFYQEEMPKHGWQAGSEEPLMTEQMAMLAYEKEGRKASITITVDNGQVSVLISVEEK